MERKARGAVCLTAARTAVRAGVVALFAAVAVGPGSSWAGPRPTPRAEDASGHPASKVKPPVDATAADVLKAVRSDRGDVVLVNVWATWCDPCRREFPALLRVWRELRAKGFRLILVSADFPDQRSNVERFLAQQGVDFATFLKAEADMPFINALDPRWSGALPASFLYDRSGKLHDFWEGATTYAALSAKLRGLLEGPRRGSVGQGGSR
jgi:thiol-disulfide isomerase/thioredoxin